MANWQTELFTYLSIANGPTQLLAQHRSSSKINHQLTM